MTQRVPSLTNAMLMLVGGGVGESCVINFKREEGPLRISDELRQNFILLYSLDSLCYGT